MEAAKLLDHIPQQYHLYLGIGGLVLLLLFVTSAAQKYQTYQLKREAALRHMFWGIQKIESALNKLNGCGVPAQLMIMCRKEVLARYLTIRQIYSSFDNIGSLIESAQQQLQSAESSAVNRNNAQDVATLNNYVVGLSELISYLNSQGHIAGMTEAQRKAYQTELGNLRADHIYSYHSAMARQHAEQQNWDAAGKSVKIIMRYIETHGPGNAYIKDLYKKANEQFKQIIMKQAPGSEPPPQQDAAASL